MMYTKIYFESIELKQMRIKILKNIKLNFRFNSYY